MAIAGTFAGLAGALDLLGWKFREDITDIQSSSIGFIGIAVALLGRNTAVGVGLAALLFAALQTGTASRSLDPSIFPPELASSLAVIIQGLVVLFVGADVIILSSNPPAAGEASTEGGDSGMRRLPHGWRATPGSASSSACSRLSSRSLRSRCGARPRPSSSVSSH